MSKRIFDPLFLLLIPLIGMTITDEINWRPFDFFTMGSLLILLGIGINLANAPKTHEVDPSSGSPVSIKQELGLTLSPIDFLYTLADQYTIYDNKINNEGFDLIRSEWIAHAANLEKQIVARLGSTEIKGSFLKIDDNGTLVLKNSNGIKKITAADIHFEEN